MAVFGVVFIPGLAASVAGPERLPWVVVTFLCFFGILVFDISGGLTHRWVNVFLYLISLGLVLLGVLEVTSESFWRDFAGAIFLGSLLFEQNSLPWSGGGPFRTTVTPGLLFLLLVLAQNIPFLPAEMTYGFCFVAILISCYLEFFSIFRENTSASAGSFMAGMRLACSGIGTLFYCNVFLPGIARQPPFDLAFIILPAIAVGFSFVAMLFPQWRRRQILFYCNWSVLIFWAALSGEPNRFYAALACLVGGVWTVMISDRYFEQGQNFRDLYLRLAGWAVPGSLLFTLVVFVLAPSSNAYVRGGCALWILNFFLYWAGIRRFSGLSSKIDKNIPWTWRHRLALFVTLVGASALAGIKSWPEILSQIWYQTGAK